MLIKDKIPNSYKYAMKNVMNNRRCNQCNFLVLIEPDSDIDYPYYCARCDKNLFEIETHIGKDGVVNEVDDLAIFVSQTLSLDGDDACEYEKLFLDMLDGCGFQLMRFETVCTKGYFLFDYRCGCILDISAGSDEFLYSSATEIIDRLDSYFYDSFVADIEQCLSDNGHDVPEYGCYAELLEYAKPLLQDCENELGVIDMVVHHVEDVDLDLAYKIDSLKYDDRGNSNEMVSD